MIPLELEKLLPVDPQDVARAVARGVEAVRVAEHGHAERGRDEIGGRGHLRLRLRLLGFRKVLNVHTFHLIDIRKSGHGVFLKDRLLTRNLFTHNTFRGAVVGEVNLVPELGQNDVIFDNPELFLHPLHVQVLIDESLVLGVKKQELDQVLQLKLLARVERVATEDSGLLLEIDLGVLRRRQLVVVGLHKVVTSNTLGPSSVSCITCSTACFASRSQIMISFFRVKKKL